MATLIKNYFGDLFTNVSEMANSASRQSAEIQHVLQAVNDIEDVVNGNSQIAYENANLSEELFQQIDGMEKLIVELERR